MFAISVLIALIIEDTHNTQKEVLKNLSKDRKRMKMVKQLPMKMINWIGRKIFGLFSHFYPLIHMRCMANYNYSKAYGNERNKMFEAPLSWLPLATTLKGLQYRAFNNCDQGQSMKWADGIFWPQSIIVKENLMLNRTTSWPHLWLSLGNRAGHSNFHSTWITHL